MVPWRNTVMASLVGGSTLGGPALGQLTQPSALEGLAEAWADDPAALAAGLAQRVDLLQSVEHVDDHALALGQESMELLAPLADRLGMARWRAELEDASFRVVAPDDHADLVAQTGGDPAADAERVVSLKAQVGGILDDLGLRGEVSGRVKSLYSLHRKMARKGLPAGEITDRLALRVQVEQVEDCYAVFEAVRGQFTVIEAETDDYIATPKPNGYRSLHTALRQPGHVEAFELQVRTFAMHEDAEQGVAAHWRYKLDA